MDLVNLSGTSRRFKSIVQQVFRKKTICSGSGKGTASVSEQHLSIVLEKMGSHFRSVRWEGISVRQLRYFSTYCDRVHTLRLSSASLVRRNIETEKSFFQNIRVLCLENCSKLYDNSMVEIVNSSPHLKQLHLLNCSKIQGKFFGKWNGCQLKKLQIRGDIPVRSNFFGICETGQLITLESLSLDCKGWKNGTEIEKLRSLENLRYLSMRNVGVPLLKRMYSSFHEYIPQVESLKIYTRNKAAGDDLTSILELISSLNNLKKFAHSSMSCKLLQMICEMRESGHQRIEIGVPPEQFNDPKQVQLFTCLFWTMILGNLSSSSPNKVRAIRGRPSDQSSKTGTCS